MSFSTSTQEGECRQLETMARGDAELAVTLDLTRVTMRVARI